MSILAREDLVVPGRGGKRSARLMPLASDIVNLNGPAGAAFADTIVLQLTYDEATAIALFGSESAARLGWFTHATNQWVVAGRRWHTAGPHSARNGAYNPASDFALGRYGVDTASNTV